MSLPEACLKIASDMDAACAAMRARQFAEQLGFNDVGRCMVATAVSELAHNILHYAGEGHVLIRGLAEGGRTGLEIHAEDHGPGIADVEAALRDHYSTGGTLGLGLPGVQRLMDEFHVESAPGRGTRVTVRKWL